MFYHILIFLYAMTFNNSINSETNDYCKSSLHGETYQGKWNYTDLNIPCQNLSLTVPHFHIFNKIQKVFCRNKEGKRLNPWCLSESALYRVRPCPIPYCNETLCIFGTQYNGNHKKTVSYKNCLSWDLFPEFIKEHRWNFPSKNYKNYCRNPNNDWDGPWCFYEEDVRVYGIENCFMTTTFCYTGEMVEECKWQIGGYYFGKMTVTYSLPCSAEGQRDPFCKDYPFRRIPSCYINSTHMDYCPIPYCFNNGFKMDESYTYFLHRNTAKGGQTCIHWNETIMKDYYAEFPENNTNHNFCRGPLIHLPTPFCFIYINNTIQATECFETYTLFSDILSKRACLLDQVDIVSDNYDFLTINSSSCSGICRISVAQDGQNLELKTASDIDFMEEFRIKIHKKTKKSFQFFINVIQLNFSVCVIEQSLKVVDLFFASTDENNCLFIAVCDEKNLISNWHLYRLVFIDKNYFCVDNRLTLTSDLSRCQTFAIETHPYSYRLGNRGNFLNQFNVLLNQNTMVKNSGIFKLKIWYSCPYCKMQRFINISQNYIIHISDFCTCVCNFKYFITIYFENGGKNMYNFQNKINAPNSSCPLFPAPDLDYPFVLIQNTNDTFYFTISAFGDSRMVIYVKRKYKLCIIEINPHVPKYYVNLSMCCIPPCYIKINITLLNEFDIQILGIYQVFYIQSLLMKWLPPIDIVIMYKRIFLCAIAQDFIHYGIFLFRIKNTKDQWKNNLSMNIDEFSPGNIILNCSLSIIGLQSGNAKIITYITYKYLLVKPFKAKILGKKNILKPNDILTCTVNEPNQDMFNTFHWVGLESPLIIKSHMMKIFNCSEGVCFMLMKGASLGLYNLKCIVSVLDYNINDKSYTIHSSTEEIIFYFAENSDFYITPNNSILFPGDIVECHLFNTPQYNNSPDYKASLWDKEYVNILFSSINFIIIPDYLFIDIYTISCNLPNEKISSFQVQKYIFRNVFKLNPTLPFYIINERLMSCVHNVEIDTLKNLNFTVDLVDMDSSDFHYSRNNSFTIFLDNTVLPGIHNITCALTLDRIYDKNLPLKFSHIKKSYLEFKLQFIAAEILDIHFKDLTYLVYLNESVEIQITPYNKYIKEEDLYYTEEPNNIFNKSEFFNKTISLYFLSNVTQGKYIITVTLKYLNWDDSQNYYWEYSLKSATIYLSGYKSFSMTPNTDVFIPTDQLCCLIDNVVPVTVMLQVYYFGKRIAELQSAESIYFNMTYLPIEREYFVNCSLTFNRYSKYIDRKIIFLSIPYSLIIGPPKIQMGTWIWCFPYALIFNHKNYNNVSLHLNWTILDMPPTDMDLFENNTVLLFSYEDGKIKINEEFSSFGFYFLKCDLIIKIQNITYTFSAEKALNLETFGTPLIGGKIRTFTAQFLFLAIVTISFLFANFGTFLILALTTTESKRRRNKFKKFNLNRCNYMAKNHFIKYIQDYAFRDDCFPSYLYEGLLRNIHYYIALSLGNIRTPFTKKDRIHLNEFFLRKIRIAMFSFESSKYSSSVDTAPHPFEILKFKHNFMNYPTSFQKSQLQSMMDIIEIPTKNISKSKIESKQRLKITNDMITSYIKQMKTAKHFKKPTKQLYRKSNLANIQKPITLCDHLPPTKSQFAKNETFQNY